MKARCAAKTGHSLLEWPGNGILVREPRHDAWKARRLIVVSRVGSAGETSEFRRIRRKGRSRGGQGQSLQ